MLQSLLKIHRFQASSGNWGEVLHGFGPPMPPVDHCTTHADRARFWECRWWLLLGFLTWKFHWIFLGWMVRWQLPVAFLQEDSIKLPVPTRNNLRVFAGVFFLKKSGLTVHAPAPALVLPTAAAKVVHSVAAIPATPALALLLASLVASSAKVRHRNSNQGKIIRKSLLPKNRRSPPLYNPILALILW